jgi:AraC family transcriptional regulator
MTSRGHGGILLSMEQPFSAFRRQTLEAPGLVISSAWFAPSLRLGSHYHDRASVSVILAGGYESVRNGATMQCGRDTVVLTPAAEPHQNVFAPAPTQMLVVELANPSAPAPQRLQSMPGAGLAQLARRAVFEMNAPDPFASLACEGLALELVAAALRLRERHDRTPPPWLRQVRDRLHHAPGRPKSISDLAASVGIERTRLIRAFRHHYQTTPAAYLRRLRVEHAAHLLAETAEPISAIALAAGFADQSHLNRVFKREMSCTPAVFRSRHLKLP